MYKLTLISLCAACSFLLPTASATTYVIEPDGSGDFPSIQEGIDAAVDGDVIELANGTFTGTGNRDINFLGKAITVRSQSGDPVLCIIDCQGTPEEPHRGFVFQYGESAESVLTGVTVRGGYGLTNETGTAKGGGIYCESSSCPSLIMCIVKENRAEWGGGVSCRDGSDATLIDCTLIDNYAADAGGGLSIEFASPTVAGCTFGVNTAGGIRSGGGLTAYYSSPEISDCSFLGNHANEEGGGAAFYGSCTPSFIRCTFAENSSVHGGGGVRGAHFCALTLESCTFWGNIATEYPGSGLYIHGDSYAVLNNTIVAFSPEGMGVWCDQTGAALLTCCDVYGNVDGDWVGFIADQLSTDGNIWEDPLLCNPEEGNYRLQEDSPCAPFSEPNPECDLIGAWPVGCDPMEIPEGTQMHAGLSLGAGRPTPFTERVKISYTVPMDARASLAIYDASGRLIRVLALGQLSGEQAVSWDGTNDAGKQVEAGAYFYKLTVGEESVSKRMLLLR